jgi:hypothetical protein
VRMTDDELTNRVSAPLAVDRALNASERTAFMQFRNVGFADGKPICDWIAEAQDAQENLGPMLKWWNDAGDNAVAYLMTLHQLPEMLVRQLIDAALHAVFGITSASFEPEPWTIQQHRRTHVEIASGAALWARGYAEALGWEPHHGQ